MPFAKSLRLSQKLHTNVTDRLSKKSGVDFQEGPSVGIVSRAATAELRNDRTMEPVLFLFGRKFLFCRRRKTTKTTWF
jgi:hypothetical protein